MQRHRSGPDCTKRMKHALNAAIQSLGNDEPQNFEECVGRPHFGNDKGSLVLWSDLWTCFRVEAIWPIHDLIDDLTKSSTKGGTEKKKKRKNVLALCESPTNTQTRMRTYICVYIYIYIK